MTLDAWGYLAVAILLEVAATAMLKLSHGFERPFYGAVSIALYWACFWALAPALKTIPVGVAYAIWAGAGIALVATVGVLFFNQRLSFVQYAFIAMIAAGGVGLRLTMPE